VYNVKKIKSFFNSKILVQISEKSEELGKAIFILYKNEPNLQKKNI
jgi:hypothetical protein